jgi:SAM-dependent methyltransferase
MLGRMATPIDPADRERLAATFDTAAALYQRVRPEYPAALYERLLDVTGLTPPARLLEVGPATGKATRPLARLGFRITALEPGAALAAVARFELKDYDVVVIESRFEDWEPGATLFDLVFAATAWHWADPSLRYAKAAAALRRRGYLAFWSAIHVIPHDGDPFFDELQEVYQEIGEGLPPGWVTPRPGQLPDESEEIEASGQFEVLDVRQYDWETVYGADAYIDLLNTFSGHIDMAPWQRERLYSDIRRRLAEREDGQLRRHWGAVLHIARLRN